MGAGRPSLQSEAADFSDQGFDVARQRIVTFIAMHIDPQPPRRSQFTEFANTGGAVGHGAFEMRDSPHHIHAHVQRPEKVRPGAGRTQVAVLGKGD
jgi:hypothetical protein